MVEQLPPLLLQAGEQGRPLLRPQQRKLKPPAAWPALYLGPHTAQTPPPPADGQQPLRYQLCRSVAVGRLQAVHC